MVEQNGDYKYETIVAEMARIAEDLKRNDVMDCFSEQILRVFLSDQGESPSASKMFARLQTSLDARKELHELERSMDKEHFVEFVTGGYVMLSGVDKSTGRPNFWWRSGLLCHNSWRYAYGSPRANAFVR